MTNKKLFKRSIRLIITSLLSLQLPSCIIASVRDTGNITFFSSAITNVQLTINLLPNVGIDIDNFRDSNIDNYDEIRDHLMTFNESTSRIVSIFSSEASVEYTIRMECLNDVFDNEEVKNPINSSQLSYMEPKKIQVNKASDYKNSACMQQGNENLPALNSSPSQHVDNNCQD